MNNYKKNDKNEVVPFITNTVGVRLSRLMIMVNNEIGKKDILKYLEETSDIQEVLFPFFVSKIDVQNIPSPVKYFILEPSSQASNPGMEQGTAFSDFT